jgi:hypothetical protein
MNRINYLKLEEYNRLATLLKGTHEFIQKHNHVSYIEFDHYAVHDMILFSIEPGFDFNQLQEIVKQIKKTLPAMKRIFKKPIIFLKDSEDVLPVENARVINQNTLTHLANHAQYISNVTSRGIKPRKLLTRIYEDKYGIYENLIFCNFVDETLSYIRRNRKTLNSIYYASNIMKFNILEKGNHINYFLAMGKLHTGYIRDFAEYHSLSKHILSELNVIYKTIKSRLYKPIYKSNRKRNRRLRIKKTNIFINQKDYRLVYKTYKYYNGKKKKITIDEDTFDFETLFKEYLMYVRVLSIFAVGHFNFETSQDCKMDLANLDVTFTFKDWTLQLSNNDKEELIFDIHKDKTYRMLLTTTDYLDHERDEYKKNHQIDEIHQVTHFEEDYLTSRSVYIGTDEIDSFRRIQQLLLKGMILADEKREVCPFCGGKLIYHPKVKFHQCFNCMLQIKEQDCPETGKHYVYTDSKTLSRNTFYGRNIDVDDLWIYRKQMESAMYYRNITKINRDGDIICPYCNKEH